MTMPAKQRKSGTRPRSGTRDRILAAAAKTLSAKGYSETRLSDIAEVAEIRPPAIYHYFDSTEALISEVMVVGQLRLRDHVESALANVPAQDDPVARIRAAVRAHLEVELRLSDFATAVTRNIGQLPDDIQDRLRADGIEYITLWRRLLEDARAVGAIRPGLDLRTARMLVMGALNWTPEWWNPRQGSLDELIATAQSLILHGLGIPAAQHAQDG